MLDLSERKRAEEALRHSEEQWRDVFENNPTMYFMVDAAGTVLAVNPFGAEMLGYRVDELVGQPVLSVCYESDREAVQRHVAQCLRQLGRASSWDARKVQKDGTVLWVRETAKAGLTRARPDRPDRRRGYDRAAARGRSAASGAGGSRPRQPGDDPGRDGRVDRARGRPAALGRGHQRERLPALPDQRVAESRRSARRPAGHRARRPAGGRRDRADSRPRAPNGDREGAAGHQ